MFSPLVPLSPQISPRSHILQFSVSGCVLRRTTQLETQNFDTHYKRTIIDRAERIEKDDGDDDVDSFRERRRRRRRYGRWRSVIAEKRRVGTLFYLFSFC